MNCIRIWGRVALRVAAVFWLGAFLTTSLWAFQRPLTTKSHNYPDAPMAIRQSWVELTETFATPTLAGASNSKARGSRIRYANRAGQLPSRYELHGQVLCQNQTRQTIEVFALTIVPMNAFHQPVRPSGQAQPYATQQVVESLPQGMVKRIPWELMVNSPDIYEVAVVVTQVRFSDGSVWKAPQEELIEGH